MFGIKSRVSPNSQVRSSLSLFPLATNPFQQSNQHNPDREHASSPSTLLDPSWSVRQSGFRNQSNKFKLVGIPGPCVHLYQFSGPYFYKWEAESRPPFREWRSKCKTEDRVGRVMLCASVLIFAGRFIFILAILILWVSCGDGWYWLGLC